MLTCIAVLLICYIQIKEIYLFSFKKIVCIIKFHIFVELKILLKSLLISERDSLAFIANQILWIFKLKAYEK